MPRPRIISNWRSAHKMATVWVGTAAAAFGLLPAEQQLAVLALVGVSPERAPAVLGVAFIVARLIDQPRARA